MTDWQPPTEQDQLAQLFKLGYFDAGWEEVKALLFGSRVVQDAVDRFADFHGVDGGDVGKEMLRPRCGLPDFSRDPQESRLQKWRIFDVTTSHRLSGLDPLSADREHAIWLNAIEAWNAVCGIKLTFIEDMARANIYAAPESTGPGVLGYSFMPHDSGPNDRIRQAFNSSTNWSERLLLNVGIHEHGHALGLDHGPAGSVMQPTASGSILSPQTWDIAQVVSRYGQPAPRQPQPPADFALTIRSRLAPGGYRLQPNATDYDFEVATAIQPGRYRAIGAFDMG